MLRHRDGHWVLCDFGSATTRAQVYQTAAEIAAEDDNIKRTTTPAYRAPEMWDLYQRLRIDTKADIWVSQGAAYIARHCARIFDAEAAVPVHRISFIALQQ